MGQQGRQVDAAGTDHVQEMGDAVLAHAFDLLDPEGVRARVADLLAVHRCVFPLGRAVHAQLHEGAVGGQHPAADLQCSAAPMVS